MLSCEEFPAPFASINGTHVLDATHFDIVRATLTVGYVSRRQATATVGPWRAVALASMVRGYLASNLSTTLYYRKLEPSEKAAMSFLMAQAFSLWFAQKHMHIPYLVHAGSVSHSWKLNSKIPKKKNAGTIKARAKPDFIGCSKHAYHVFESKGRSSHIKSSLVRAALAQASVINEINGVAPQTRVAACFSFRAAGTSGRIVDPKADREFSLNLNFDRRAAILGAYKLFLELDFESLSRDASGEFLVASLDEHLEIGIDFKAFKTLQEVRQADDERAIDRLFELLEERRSVYLQRSGPATSVGIDGILVSGRMPELAVE